MEAGQRGQKREPPARFKIFLPTPFRSLFASSDPFSPPPFIVFEDVVTRGGRVQETIDIVRAHGGQVAAVAALVDRSGGNLPDFGCPFIALTQLNVETFEPDKLPPDLTDTPAVKPGSK